VASKLLSAVQSLNTLERAWRVIEENARTSRSIPVREEVERFQEKQSKEIRSLSSKLSAGTFKFEPATGVPIKKKGKKKVRPIVLATLKSRIVQRAVHDVLLSVPTVREFMFTPHSFGGIGKEEDDELSAVPAAMEAVLETIRAGAKYVAYADISEFFTRISKPTVTKLVSDIVRDDAFISLFSKAIAVELANLATLKEHASKFPTHEIGVAQGNSLSPLLGNLLLYEFDREMNTGDCRCIRYIDDFIILAPTAQAAKARLKKARSLLAKHGMTISEEKSSKEPLSTGGSFEFLGIELNNGLIRPTRTAQLKILEAVQATFQKSAKALYAHKGEAPFDKYLSLLATLKRVDGMVQGWGKHYRFCNDTDVFVNLDRQISDEIRKYIGAYTAALNKSGPIGRRRLLGVQQLAAIDLSPLKW
jgi:RNA-directed DNA polymerase